MLSWHCQAYPPIYSNLSIIITLGNFSFSCIRLWLVAPVPGLPATMIEVKENLHCATNKQPTRFPM